MRNPSQKTGPDRAGDGADTMRPGDSIQADDYSAFGADPADDAEEPPDEGPVSVAGAAGKGIFRTDPGLPPGLYVVATPIGNLRDITLRALDVLASVDFICAEDTRTTRKLLSAFGIRARLRAYHDHNGVQVRPQILSQLEAGGRVALVSDAGTPLVSDPGYKLVREAAELGVPVIPLPGASAVLAGLVVSGLPTDRFLFAGFPSPKAGARRACFAALASTPATLAFFEGPSRLAASLADMSDIFGDREAVVARELTKTFEETRRGRLADLARFYAEEGSPRGELVILVGPPERVQGVDPRDLDAALLAADPDQPIKAVAEAVALKLGLPRREVYQRALALRGRGGAQDEGDANGREGSGNAD